MLRLLAAVGCSGASGDASCDRAHGRAEWTRIRSVPLGSGRPGRCTGGSSPAEERAQRRGLDSGAERPRNWTRRGQGAALAYFRPRRPGLPGGGLWGHWRFLPLPTFQKPNGSWRRDSTYGKTAKRRSPRRVARKIRTGAYGPPRGPRRVAIRAENSHENFSRGTLGLASGDSDPPSRLACARWRMENYGDGGRTHGSVSS